jgi:hypothetical protein
MFPTKVVEKIKTRILCPMNSFFFFFFSKIVPFMRDVEIYCTPRQATNDDMAQAHCMLDTKATYTHAEYVIIIAYLRNNGSTNAPQCYVIRTLPVFL